MLRKLIVVVLILTLITIQSLACARPRTFSPSEENSSISSSDNLPISKEIDWSNIGGKTLEDYTIHELHQAINYYYKKQFNVLITAESIDYSEKIQIYQNELIIRLLEAR